LIKNQRRAAMDNLLNLFAHASFMALVNFEDAYDNLLLIENYLETMSEDEKGRAHLKKVHALIQDFLKGLSDIDDDIDEELSKKHISKTDQSSSPSFGCNLRQEISTNHNVLYGGQYGK
jgi:hypothetical protein